MKIITLLIAAFLLSSCSEEVKNNSDMGMFDKLFGKNEPSKKEESKNYDRVIQKTSEMLDEAKYWSIIEKSIRSTENQESQEQFLETEIEKLTPEQMIGFRLRTDNLLFNTYTSEMWCAGYIMNGGCSDDGFEYFRNWIISRGKDVYYMAKENPDSLISEFIEGEEYYEFEGFWYVALTAFENKTGKVLYDYISDDFTSNESAYPSFEFNWKEEEPETMKIICPKLFEKMWI